MTRLAARIRVPLLILVLFVLLTQPWSGLRLPWWVACPALGAAFALYARVGRVRTAPAPMSPPVRGTWRAVNSPSSRIPSHGVHAYGQTYAIDLVFQPFGGPPPRLTWRPLARRASDFAGFGQPVHSASPGRVIRVRQGQRDHWSRNSVPGLIYLLAEGMIREIFGAGRVVGNHIVVDMGEGRYALYAHLQQHSATVRPGDLIRTGQQLARCGNSGNSSEPHLHFQVMDRSRPTFAAGLPFQFTDQGGTAQPAPRTGEWLVVDTVDLPTAAAARESAGTSGPRRPGASGR